MDKVYNVKEVYTIKELTELLKCSKDQAKRLVLGDQIKAFRLGNQWRVTGKAIEDYIKKVEDPWWKPTPELTKEETAANSPETKEVPANNLKDLFTVKELMEYFQSSKITIIRLFQEKKIKGFKLGQKWMATETAVKEFIETETNKKV